MKLIALRAILKDASRRLGGFAPLFTGLARGVFTNTSGQSSEKARPCGLNQPGQADKSGSHQSSWPVPGSRMALGAASGGIIRRLAWTCMTLMLAAAALPSLAAPVAGTVIRNTAYVSYTVPAVAATPGLGGLPTPASNVTNQPSNTVEAVITQVAAFTLTSSQSRFSPIGTTVYFFHTLTNTGNGPDSFDLSTVASASPWVAALALYRDTSPADGVPDSTVPVTSTGALAAGQSFTFVAAITIPPTAVAGQNSSFEVRAQGNAAAALAGGYTAATQLVNTDTVRLTASAVLAPVGKSFSVTEGPSPSTASITVNVTYTNNTPAVATNVRITDWIGVSSSSPIVFNTTGMRYVAGSARWSSCGGGATALSDAAEGAAECGPTGAGIRFEVVYPLSPATSEARIEALIESVPAYTSGMLTFKVDVVGGLAAGSAATTNAARLTYFDGTATQTIATNQAKYNVTTAPPDTTDLKIAKTISKPSSGNFTIGNAGEYTLQVTNVGLLPSTGTITVTDTLPGGLEVTGMSGTGWSCTQSGSHASGTATLTGGGVTVTCTSTSAVPAQAGTAAGSAAPIRLTVVPRTVSVLAPVATQPLPPAAIVTRTLTNTATVAGGGEPAANNTNNAGAVSVTVGPSANVTGRVWQDVNHNRVYNLGTDKPLEGWSVEVFDLATFVNVGTGSTASSGSYTISGLIPGPYGIRFRDPASNVVNGRPVCGTSDTACSTASFSGNMSQLDASGTFLRVTLTAGDTVLEQNLPLDPSGIVYDGQTGAAIAGAQVTLTVKTLAGAVAAGFNPAIHLVGGAAALAQTTGATGFYQFVITAVGSTFCQGLAGGGCLLEIGVTAPAGYQAFTVSQGLVPPQASLGGCIAANCIDPTGLAAPGPYQVSAINVAPVLPVNQPYFLRFFLSPGDPDVVNNHLPLFKVGAVLGANLLVTKSASRASAEIGDFVDYTVRVFNGGAAAATPARVTDILPAGFKYVAGSSRLTTPPATTASVIADPAGGAGPTLVWPVGSVTAGGTVVLTYRAQLSVNAAQGDGINRASASAPGFGSNTATVKVRVLGGVFSDRGFITGTVFADCNRDRVQGAREPGIPGVRLFMEDGTSVVTDSEGKFSLYGISPRTHVMKIDSITMPLGSELIALNNRNAGDPSSRFVDVKKGELVRADFAEGSCSPEVMQQIKARREKGETAQAELNRAFTGALPAAPAAAGGAPAIGAAAQGNAAGGSAQPVLGAHGSSVNPAVFQPVQALGPVGSVNSSNSNLPPKQGDLTNAQLPDVAQPPISSQPLEELIVDMDNSFALLNLKNGDTLPLAQTNIQIKGMLGANFSVLVNGVEVPQSRVGKRSRLELKGIEAWEYIGVTLKAGSNEIVARQADGFGNARGEVKLSVVAPGTMAKIVVDTVASSMADGATPITVKVRLVDDKDVPVTSRTSITLQSNLGRWLVQDLNPLEAGTQVFITGGTGEYQLVAPADPGEALIDVSGGVLKGTKKVSFLPHLRPLIGAGIIEGAINFNSLSLKNLVSPQGRDNFEQEIRRFHYESGDGKRSTEARASMFLKGQVKGDYLLTLAYDSDKDLRDRVFRDISPDEFYPIYGDSSSRAFDAQTSGRFFVRVDKGKSFVLYGDYPTAGPPGARALSQFSRSLTGAKWHLEGAPYSVNTFVSRDTFRQRVQEFAANGTSGPFLLNLPSGSVINSEKVELITRDRNQAALILLAETKGRFADYEIEPYTGRLLFRAPVSSLDSNLNPVSIRITYEIDQGGTPFWIGGIDGQYKINDSIEIGAALVKDQNPGQEFTMAGVNGTWKIFEKTVLVAESAATDRKAPALTAGPAAGAVVGNGRARRVELRHSDGAFDARLHMGRADATFDNPSSTLNRGRSEMGARGTYKLTTSTNLSTEFLRTGDVSTGASRDSIQLRADHGFANGVRVAAGLRHSTESSPAAANGASVGTTPNAFTSVLTTVTAPVPGLPQASVNASYEQAIQGDDRKAVGLGAEYKLSPTARIYGRHESISSLSGPNGLSPALKNNTTVFGVDTKVTESTQVFSEYRGRSSLDGATSEASMGVRNTFAISEGLRVTGSLERLQPIQRLATGTTSTESTALTGGVEYTANPLWKGSARLELRNSTTTDSALSTLSIAYKLTRDWALLARNTYSITQQKGATPGDQERLRFQIGAAYRDTDSNKLSALSRYEHREEKDTVASPILKRAADIASFHFNYQPNRSWILSGRYAAKYVTENSLGIESTSSGHLVSGRLTHDITSKWDVGIITSLHTDGGFGNRKLGLGLEVGYLLQENLWLSGGYNLFGFKDKDLAGQDYTDRGFFVRLRYKFDETLFDWKKDAALRAGAAAAKP